MKLFVRGKFISIEMFRFGTYRRVYEETSIICLFLIIFHVNVSLTFVCVYLRLKNSPTTKCLPFHEGQGLSQLVVSTSNDFN